MMKLKPALLFAIFFFFLFHFAPAQISTRELPPSFRNDVVNENYPVFEVRRPDVASLLNEDAVTDKYGIPKRFAVAQPLRIDICRQGAWTNLGEGTRICRLALHAPGAQAIILYYDEFEIPEGGKLFVYSRDQRMVAGAFDHSSNVDGGGFANEMIPGETVVIEYAETSQVRQKASLILDEAGYVYRTAGGIFAGRGFGGSDTCEVNVNCPEGNQWQLQKRGVARIIVKQGATAFWCTGSLINNVRQDQTPYMLTADHCGPNASSGDLEKWVFYFRYEGPGCQDPPNDLGFNFYTMIGAQKIASSGGAGVGSDFKLLLLDQRVPFTYDPYFIGWSKLNEPSPTGVTIHHPEGDIKKISTYTQPLVSSNWSSIPGTHWEVVWAQTETNWGVTEGGSSGAPLFNSQGLLIGQLTGGEAGCSNPDGPDYYGKLWYSWDQNPTADSTMLKPWLDPDNTGALSVNGLVDVAELQSGQQQPKVYPNPTHGRLYVDFLQTGIRSADIFLFDVMGNLILKHRYQITEGNAAALDLRSFKPGIYLLEVRSIGGTFTSKVIR